MLQKLGRSLNFLCLQERSPDPGEVGAGSLVEALVPSSASWRSSWSLAHSVKGAGLITYIPNLKFFTSKFHRIVSERILFETHGSLFLFPEQQGYCDVSKLILK